MADFLAFTVLGVALGALYAVVATGVVVTYTTSGIFNFAHGGFAMLGAYLYWQLRWDDGWGGRWAAPLAFVFVVFVAAPLFGAFVERVVMRGLRDTSETTKVVIPIALLLALIGLANWIWGSPEPREPQEFFGATKSVTIGDQPVTYHQLIVFGCALALALSLRILLYNTRLGVNMRAVVDSRDLAELNGARPHRISMAAWAISASLAALAGILISPQLGSLVPFGLTLLLVNAYAATVFGRLRSLPLTFAGALIIGLVVNWWAWIKNEWGADWNWLSNLRPTLPVILLLLFLLLLPEERLRGATVARTRERFRVPTPREAVVWAGVLVVVVWALVALMERAPKVTMGVALGGAIIALSVVLLTGYAGEINLAPMTFAGIGAMVLFQWDVGIDGRATAESASVTGYILAAVVCAAVGAFVALPALRLRGVYLGLATFAFAIIVSLLIFKQISTLDPPWDFALFGFRFDEVNLFSNGSMTIPRPNWFGVDFKTNETAWLVFLAAVFAVLGIGLVLLRRSAYGRRLAAMKDSPAACATLGMNLVRLKLSVFALSAGIAGFGGALLAGHRGSAIEDDFVIWNSLALFMLTVVGGVGYITGGLIGGIMSGAAFIVIGDVWERVGLTFTSFDWLFNFLRDWFVFLGPALAGIGLGRNPSGIASQLFEGYRPLRSREGVPFLAGGLAAVAAIYFLALSGTIGNWTFVLLLVPVLLLLPPVAMSLRPQMLGEDEPVPEDAVPAELVGIDRPFDVHDLELMDTELQLAELGYKTPEEELELGELGPRAPEEVA